MIVGVAQLRVCSGLTCWHFSSSCSWPVYMGLSSGRLAYAGQQAGVSFVVAYAALSPEC